MSDTNRKAFCEIMERRYGPPRSSFWVPPNRDDVPAWTALDEHSIMTTLFVTGDPWEHLREIAEECMARRRPGVPAVGINVQLPFGGYGGRNHREREGISIIRIMA